MSILSVPTSEQISGQDLVTLLIEELEGLLLQMYATLEETFDMINNYAQEATRVEAPFPGLSRLASRYKQTWTEMKATVDAIICHAVFADFTEKQWNKLVMVACEENALLRAVVPCPNVNPEWLAQRDTLVAQTTLLLKDIPKEDNDRTLSALDVSFHRDRFS